MENTFKVQISEQRQSARRQSTYDWFAPVYEAIQFPNWIKEASPDSIQEWLLEGGLEKRHHFAAWVTLQWLQEDLHS